MLTARSALCRCLTGRYDEAEQAFLNNYRIRRLHRLPLLEGAWRQLGELRLAQGKPAEAIRFLHHGLEARKFSRSYYTSFLTWEVMGRAFQQMGERSKAREAFRRAFDESKPWRDEIAPSEGLEIAADVRLSSLAASFASVSAATGMEAWEAFEAIESTRAAGLRRQVLANRALAGAIPAEQLILVRTARNLQRLALNGDQRAAAELRSVEFSLRRLEGEKKGLTQSTTAAGRLSADSQRVIEALAPGQVLISLLVDPRAARIWVLSRYGRSSAPLPDLPVLSRAVEQHRSAVLAGGDARDEGHKLYQLLFSKVPRELLAQPHWSVVADGPLWSVPWAALVPTLDNGGQYLIQNKSIELIPSATWLLSPRSQTESTVMLAAGNAIHNRADARFLPSSPAVPLSFWDLVPFQVATPARSHGTAGTRGQRPGIARFLPRVGGRPLHDAQRRRPDPRQSRQGSVAPSVRRPSRHPFAGVSGPATERVRKGIGPGPSRDSFQRPGLSRFVASARPHTRDRSTRRRLSVLCAGGTGCPQRLRLRPGNDSPWCWTSRLRAGMVGLWSPQRNRYPLARHR